MLKEDDGVNNDNDGAVYEIYCETFFWDAKLFQAHLHAM